METRTLELKHVLTSRAKRRHADPLVVIVHNNVAEAKLTRHNANTVGNKSRSSPVLHRTARLFVLATVLAVGCVLDCPSHEAQAQQVQQGSQGDFVYAVPTIRRDKKNFRRPPLMPPTPKDFGPHFDFPGGGSYNFNCGPGYGPYCGAPSHAPYPD
jgi:hypothetical protein